jgi:hypothetical protein
VGLAGIGAFTYFGISGLEEKSRLRSSCAPACTDDQTATLRARYLAADVSLGVGVIALAVAGYLFFHPTFDVTPAATTTTNVSIAPSPGGATLGVVHTF